MNKTLTSNLYDSCNRQQTNNQSKGPGQYQLSTPQNNNTCLISDSPFGKTSYLDKVPPGMVDTESELRGYSRNLSRCNQDKFPYKQNKVISDGMKKCATNVNKFLIPEYTRMDNKKSCHEDIYINKPSLIFQPLCDDLQMMNKIPDNSVIGLNTRLYTRDAYEKKK